ncbi:hypothetical protein [Futiania mangrovi]|uniref:Uncharacterized protein n=1 Tax=Futiania mangrovi TaxID=2959716 RepID=A0A9J6PJM8_9PROT|nr:hypothetical protein [Futiania mangrovii]MCP1336282.1 hypothetical protein [Futiania mangrovii]
MIDRRQIISVPRWAKALLVLLLGFVLATSIVVALRFIGQDGKTDLVLISLSLAQSTITIFFVGLIVVFAEMGTDVSQIERKSEDFLTSILPSRLSRIVLDGVRCQARPLSDIDIFGKLFELRFGSETYRVWIGLNVKRLLVIHFIGEDPGNAGFQSYSQRQPSASFSEWLRQDVFSITLQGAEKVGYEVNCQRATVDGEPLVAIWMAIDCGDDFILSPGEKLFWSNDIAMMTESFLRTAVRNGLNLRTSAVPQPL